MRIFITSIDKFKFQDYLNKISYCDGCVMFAKIDLSEEQVKDSKDYIYNFYLDRLTYETINKAEIITDLNDDNIIEMLAKTLEIKIKKQEKIDINILPMILIDKENEQIYLIDYYKYLPFEDKF